MFTRASDGTVCLYENGKKVRSSVVAGNFSNWNDSYRLSIANEITGDRPWLGDLHLVAVYGRALDEFEVGRNFAVGAPIGVDYATMLPAASFRSTTVPRSSVVTSALAAITNDAS